MTGLGLIKTGKKKKELAAREEAVAELRTADYFNPNYFKNKKFKSIGSGFANIYAQEIRKALKGLGTDEEFIFSTFGKLYNKINISEIAASYFLQYNRDLAADLSDELTDKDTADLIEIVDGLPNS
jgi:hypothetical protein